MLKNMLALEIKELKKNYNEDFFALNNISLDVKQGDFFALLGPNGAGKSTTIGIICGLIKKTSGLVRVFGHDITTDSYAAKANIGIVPQEINFSQFETCLDIILNQGGFYGVDKTTAFKRTKKYLKKLNLWEKRFERSGNLSGGMKRRLMIARALVHEPKMLILDEPTAGVDVELRHSMLEFLIELNRTGITIVLTTHYLEEAEYLCKNIAIINKGKLVENTSIKKLLLKLNKETFIFNLVNPLSIAPKLSGFRTTLVDNSTVEIEVNKDKNLNELFVLLTQLNIKVSSMRNKSNRLEAFFLNMLNYNKEI